MTNQKRYEIDPEFRLLADEVQAKRMMINPDIEQAMEMAARLLCVGRFGRTKI